MKTNRLPLAFPSAVLIIFTLVLSVLAATRSTVEAKAKDWVGSWTVDIAVVQQNSTFPGLMTFASDGNVLSDETPSPLETSGHGSWAKTGTNTGVYTFVFLIGSTDPGKWIRGTVRGKLEYKPQTDQWNGPFVINLVDQDGNEVLSDTGTMSGKRITAEP